MTRADRIAQIIEQRQPLARRIGSVISNLESLRTVLHDIESYRQHLLQKVDNAEVTQNLNAIDLVTPHHQLTQELGVLEKLQARFTRDTLNIGVVGRISQGKSTLLQSITGLGNDIIPARGGGEPCTAVKSVVHHRPGQETQAKITFHSVSSLFKEVILPYFEKLSLRPVPRDFENFIRTPFEHPEPNDATKIALLNRLKSDYYDKASYRNLLGIEPIIVSANEIKGYVTHFNESYNSNNFKNLAVKEVEIYCDFANSDVGKIALVDIPGLGDLVLGDKALMLKALGQEVDTVLFIRFPNPIGDALGMEDTNLYDDASVALTDLQERAFMVFNQIKNNQESENICRIFQSQISGLGIRVVESFIVDCSNPDEVNQLVLDKVLNYLSTTITSLDNRLASSYQERLLEIQHNINVEINKARNLLGSRTPNNDLVVFTPLFDELWNDLANGLQLLLKNLREQREDEDIDFKNKVEEVLKNCRSNTGLPTIEEIHELAAVKGGYPNAYFEYLNELRPHLSQHFLCLDDGLQKSLVRVKSQVATVLIEKGKLGVLTDARDFTLLKNIADLIPEKVFAQNNSELKFGFRLLADFELSYRGMIQHRIRQHLDILTPNEPESPLLSNAPSAEQVLLNLKTAYFQAAYNCENVLNDVLREPSQAAFAIVEEFLDRILRVRNIRNEWLVFLYEYRSEIWPSVFKDLADQSRLQREWLDVIEKVNTANQLSLIQFI